jgi:hypothetical protein
MKYLTVLLLFFSFNSYALYMFNCGEYDVHGELSGETLTLFKSTMSEVTIPVKLSPIALHIRGKRKKIFGNFKVIIKEKSTKPSSARIIRINPVKDPTNTSSAKDIKLRKRNKCN